MTSIITAADVQAIVTDMRLPAINLFPGDWLRDNVSGCSPNGQALWLREMFVMHDARPYGHLIENGVAMRIEAIARRCGFRVAECERAAKELLDAGVPRMTGDDDYRHMLSARVQTKDKSEISIDLSPLGITTDGVLYSRRMLQRIRVCVIRKIVGAMGGNPHLVREEEPMLARRKAAR